jgi:hypothetical protein
MPEATLAVRRAAFRGLLNGQAVPVENVAIAVGLPVETVRTAVGLVVSVGVAQTDDGLIIGMDGLTTNRTQHRLILDVSAAGRGAPTTLSGSPRRSEQTPSGVRLADSVGRRSISASSKVSPRPHPRWDGYPTNPA